ncbi:MAG: hypothetical protein CR991_02600 [Proteobacteria bacterium]|nr:MAG: hypothetical protein CR991_02600 [Pseudomonadota bacterium]
MGILGCFLVTGTDSEIFSLSEGLLWGLVCGFAFAIFNIIGNYCKEKNIESSTITFYSFFFSSIIWLCIFPFTSITEISITCENTSYIFFISVIATIIPYWLLLHGLRYVDALPATIIGMLDPIAAGIVAYILIGEEISMINCLGILLVMFAVILSTHRNRIDI